MRKLTSLLISISLLISTGIFASPSTIKGINTYPYVSSTDKGFRINLVETISTSCSITDAIWVSSGYANIDKTFSLALSAYMSGKTISFYTISGCTANMQKVRGIVVDDSL